MTNRGLVVSVTVVMGVAAAAVGCTSAAQSPAPAPTQEVVVANGVRLHAADWGGRGPWLVFLPPGGESVDEHFRSLAPLFTDRFRVVGLTRRGQGRSDKPAGPYDTDTLVRDVVAFLDWKGIRQAHLIGHSTAGAEMTRFAVQYPSRVSALVYLDAAVDYKAHAALAADAGLEPSPDPVVAAIQRGAAERAPEYSRVMAPGLNVAVVFDGAIPSSPDDPAPYKRYLKLAEERDIVGQQIRTFQRDMRRGEVPLAQQRGARPVSVPV